MIQSANACAHSRAAQAPAPGHRRGHRRGSARHQWRSVVIMHRAKSKASSRISRGRHEVCYGDLVMIYCSVMM